MFEDDKLNKIQQWIFFILLVIFIVLLGVFTYELIDLHNDYVCVTTTNADWFNSHHCIKYFND